MTAIAMEAAEVVVAFLSGRLLPAESLNTEGDESTGGNNLDDTVDTTGEQSRLATSDTYYRTGK